MKGIVAKWTVLRDEGVRNQSDVDVHWRWGLEVCLQSECGGDLGDAAKVFVMMSKNCRPQVRDVTVR